MTKLLDFSVTTN